MKKLLVVSSSSLAGIIVLGLLFVPRTLCACITDGEMFEANYRIDPREMSSEEIIVEISSKFALGTTVEELERSILAYGRNCEMQEESVYCLYDLSPITVGITFEIDKNILVGLHVTKT